MNRNSSMSLNVKSLVCALIALVAVAGSARAASRVLPVCNGIDHNLKVGTKCQAASDALSVLRVVAAKTGDFTKLVADGRSVYSVEVEVLRPKKSNFTNTLRYTFRSAACSGWVGTCSSQALWVVDSYIDTKVMDDSPTFYEVKAFKAK